MKLAELFVEIKADMSKFQAGMRTMQGTLRTTGAAIGNWVNRSRMAFLAIAAEVGLAVKAFAEQEDADYRLAAALKNLTGESATAMIGLKKFASEMQNITTYSDDAIEGMMALGVTLGKLSGRDLTNATRAAIGLAEVMGVDARTAMTLLVKAIAGNFASFSRYGIVLDQFKTKQEKVNYLLEIGNKGFSIQEERAKGAMGGIAQLTNAFSDIQEEIGGMLAPGGALNGLVTLLKGIAKTLKDLNYLTRTPFTEDLTAGLTPAQARLKTLIGQLDKFKEQLAWIEKAKAGWKGDAAAQISLMEHELRIKAARDAAQDEMKTIKAQIEAGKNPIKKAGQELGEVWTIGVKEALLAAPNIWAIAMRGMKMSAEDLIYGAPVSAHQAALNAKDLLASDMKEILRRRFTPPEGEGLEAGAEARRYPRMTKSVLERYSAPFQLPGMGRVGGRPKAETLLEKIVTNTKRIAELYDPYGHLAD